MFVLQQYNEAVIILHLATLYIVCIQQSVAIGLCIHALQRWRLHCTVWLYWGMAVIYSAIYHIRTCMSTIHVYIATYNYNNILTSCSPWFDWITHWSKDSGFSWWHMRFWWLWADVGQWTENYWGWFWQQLLWVWTDVSGCTITKVHAELDTKLYKFMYV